MRNLIRGILCRNRTMIFSRDPHQKYIEVGTLKESLLQEIYERIFSFKD